MTRILEIVGTEIRRELDSCDDCPCRNGEYEECRLFVDGRAIAFGDAEWTPEWCPLPEKCPVCGAMTHPDYNFDREGEPAQIGWYCRECLHKPRPLPEKPDGITSATAGEEFRHIRPP